MPNMDTCKPLSSLIRNIISDRFNSFCALCKYSLCSESTLHPFLNNIIKYLVVVYCKVLSCYLLAQVLFIICKHLNHFRLWDYLSIHFSQHFQFCAVYCSLNMLSFFSSVNEDGTIHVR